MIILFVVAVVILLVVVIILAVALNEAKKYGTKLTEELVGMSNFTFERSEKRQDNLAKIITLFETDTELTNTEVRKLLGVSSRTAVRYMDELEKQNKVMQVGKIGHTVTYCLK
jgi:predicted HTH transcriptional regulator